MFQGADFGSGPGKLIAMRSPRGRFGQDDDSDDSSDDSSSGLSLQDILSTAQSAATTAATIKAAVSTPTPVAATSTLITKTGTGLMSNRIAGIPVVILVLAIAGGGAYFIMKKK